MFKNDVFKSALMLLLACMFIIALAACSSGNNESTNGANNETADNSPKETATETPKETNKAEQPTGDKITLQLAGRNDDIPNQEQLANMFMAKYPNIKVELVNLDGPPYETLLMQNKAAGTLPDVGFLSPEFIGRFIEAEMIAEIPKEAFEAVGANIDDLYPALREGASVDGKLYLVPRSLDIVGVFINKTMIESAGLELPNDDWTWDQFLDMAKTLTKKDDNGNVTQFGAFMHNAWEGVYHSLWMANGGEWVDYNAKKVNLTDPKVMQAVNVQMEAVKAGYIADDMTTSGNPFLEGKAAMWVHIKALADPVDKAAKEKGFDWDTVSYPELQPKANQLIGFNGYYVSKDTKYPKEAGMLAAFVASPEVQTEIFSKSGTPASKPIADAGEWMKYPVEGKNYGGFTKHSDRFYYNSAGALIPGEVYGALHGGNRDAMTAVLKGEKSLIDAYTALEKTVNELWAKQP